MIKISREAKTGVAAIIILILFYWGFNFLKGKNLFDGALQSYYVEYNDIKGLTTASPVAINGHKVGKVLDISFMSEPGKQGKLLVQFTVESDIEISKNSTVKIYSGLMGGTSLIINPKFDGDLAETGYVFNGSSASGVFSSLTDKINPLQAKIGHAIVNVDSLVQHMNNLLDPKMIKDLHESVSGLNFTIKNLERTSYQVNGLLANNKENLNATLANVKVTTDNFKSLSDSLAQIKLLDLSKKLDVTAKNLASLTTDMQAGKGTLGKLAKDEQLYDNLEDATRELELLLRDMKENPKRYVHFSIFGKKDNGYQESK